MHYLEEQKIIENNLMQVRKMLMFPKHLLV